MFSYLIVDGYNIINKWPALIQAQNKNLEFARSRLFHLMQSYCDFTGMKGMIVYDGREKKRSVEKGNPTVIFSQGGESADSVVESFVYNIDEAASIRLVTDDRAMANMVIGMGASVVSTKIFKADLESALSQLRDMIED